MLSQNRRGKLNRQLNLLLSTVTGAVSIKGSPPSAFSYPLLPPVHLVQQNSNEFDLIARSCQTEQTDVLGGAESSLASPAAERRTVSCPRACHNLEIAGIDDTI